MNNTPFPARHRFYYSAFSRTLQFAVYFDTVEMPFGFNKRSHVGERLVLNARAEGVFNKENAQNDTGELGILICGSGE